MSLSYEETLNILKETGVDLTNDEIYTYSFDDMKKSLQEAKLLIKHIKSQNEKRKKC